MELTERKKKILRAIVEQYIRTAEPVCSKAVCELPELFYVLLQLLFYLRKLLQKPLLFLLVFLQEPLLVLPGQDSLHLDQIFTESICLFPVTVNIKVLEDSLLVYETGQQALSCINHRDFIVNHKNFTNVKIFPTLNLHLDIVSASCTYSIME